MSYDAESFLSSGSTLFTRTSLPDGGDLDDRSGPLGLSLIHSPPEPLIDFVFVHGLGGGSRKTWSKNDSSSHFWPREWLPKDPAFKNVRLHSFGYNSQWSKRKDNVLNVHDFGKSLLAELSVSPSLSDEDTPIVFIGHSMGGLVIKKAYMLARQDGAHRALANRFHTIFFLATPHRGSDAAQILNNILHAAYSSRAYVADLERNSGAIQSINDEFRQYSGDVEVWSFYETQKLSLAIFSKLIVDKDSATLGYREEKQVPVNADHRSICKFDSPADPNYRLLRNALETIVRNSTKLAIQSREKLRRSQMKDLEKYLGVSEKPEDDLIAVQDSRLPGTCEWLSRRQT